MSSAKLNKASRTSDRTKTVDAKAEEEQETEERKATESAYALLKKADDELKEAPVDIVKYLVDKHPFEDTEVTRQGLTIENMITSLATAFDKEFVAMNENKPPFFTDVNHAGDMAMVGKEKEDVMLGICSMAQLVLKMVIYAAIRGKELFPNTKPDPSPNGKRTPMKKPTAKGKKNMVTYAAARFICK
jgi:hypothetical protein